MEVGQHRDRQAGGISVTPRLKRRVPVAVDMDARLFGFDEKLALASKAQFIVRLLGEPLFANLNRGLFNDFPQTERLASRIVHVPSERR